MRIRLQGTPDSMEPGIGVVRTLGLSSRAEVDGARRIAVLRANGLGDFVLSLPALDALRAAYPDARITYLGLSWHRELLTGRPGPWDEVDVVPPFPGVSAPPGPAPAEPDEELVAFLRRHQAARYDLAFQLHGGGAHSNPLVHRLHAALTVGGRDRDAPPLDRSLPFRHLQHETLRNLEIVGLAGIPPVTLIPELTVTENDRRAAAAGCPLVQSPPDDMPLVALHPGAGDPRRRLPVTDLAAVVEALARDGAVMLVVGSAVDRPLGARLMELAEPAVRAGRLVDLTGRLGLSGLVGLLAAADVMIGNDSGPRHLAEAVGTPTVGVFWCGNVINAGPLNRGRHRVITSFQNTCPRCGAPQEPQRCPHDPSFVAGVPVEEIITEARGLLGRDWAS